MQTLSPLRARLTCFEHAYVVAIRRRTETGHHQFVVRTGDPLQPVKVTPLAPASSDQLLALVV